MPPVLVAVELGARTTMKAGLSRTFARPDYIHLVPFSQIDEDDLEIERGNPDLRLTRAWNADLSLEWRASDATSLGFAAYYKSIDDFVFESRTDVEFDDRTFALIRPENGRTADLSGVEANLSHRNLGTS